MWFIENKTTMLRTKNLPTACTVLTNPSPSAGEIRAALCIILLDDGIFQSLFLCLRPLEKWKEMYI